MLWSSWVLNECNLSFKIVKNCRIIGFDRAKKNQILSKVCEIKRASLVLFTWDVMRKSMFKRLVYTPPDLSPRFTSKVNLSNTKSPAWFFILASLDFLKVVRMVFWSGVVVPGTSFRTLVRASRSALVLSRYALKSSTCEQVYGLPFRQRNATCKLAATKDHRGACVS